MIRYRVEFTDTAQAEVDAAYLWRSRQTSPEEAAHWYADLFAAAQTLSAMPRRWARVPNSARYEGDVRRMLYGIGPSAYHLVYRIIEPAEDEEEGVVRILHVYHGARRADESEKDSET